MSNIEEGDIIHIEKTSGYACVKVSKVIGNRIYYDCEVSDGIYYGTTQDRHTMHTSILEQDNFTVEKS